MSRIIYSKPDGGVSVVMPVNSTANLNQLAAKVVPSGASYEIVSSDLVFPVDRIFRDAWTWAGSGSVILENLTKSKEIAVEAMKEQVREDVTTVADAAFFGEAVNADSESIQSFYLNLGAEVNSCTDVYELKLLMCAFLGLPTPELPRDEVLKAQAEAARIALAARIAEIKTEVAKYFRKVVAVANVVSGVAQAINGYYPLYTTEAEANAAGDGASHTHEFDGVTYYMPDSGTTIYHGSYTY